MRILGRSPRRPSQADRTVPRPRVARAEEATPLDPVALTLAVWLGLIACVTGVIRLSENAAAQAALARRGETPAQQVDMSKGFGLGN